VFNIGGNRHRLVVHVTYEAAIVLIKFVGSYAEYDAVDATSVGGGGGT
jgi:mRNA interferase HigB